MTNKDIYERVEYWEKTSDELAAQIRELEAQKANADEQAEYWYRLYHTPTRSEILKDIDRQKAAYGWAA